MKRKILMSIILVLVAGFTTITAFASSGTYGDIKYEIIEGEVTITGCNSNVTDLEIPSSIEGCPVTTIEEYAFSHCDTLVSVTIPDSIEELPKGIFCKIKRV